MNNKILKKTHSFLKDERGATAIEYSVIAAFISVSIVAFVGPIGDKVLNLYKTLAAEINS